MSYSSLAEFLEELAPCGQLARLSAEVDPVLEIAEITRRVASVGGPALLFDRVRGASMAVVTNLLGSEARVCRALGVESLDEISARIESLIAKNTPQNWFDRLKISGDEAGANKFRSKTVKSGPCQQVVRLGRDVDLAGLPLLKQWPGESGPAITAGMLVTQDRGGELPSATICPLQALDPTTLAVLDDGQRDFARHWANHQAAGEKMPAAVVLGGDPAGTVAASLELPTGIDAYHLTGLARGRAVDLVKCRTHALLVPAEADVILEGYFDPETPGATVACAAAGASHYRAPRPAPVLHVTAITHRSHPIVPMTVDCGQQGEVAALSKARERMLLPAVRTTSPDVVDLHLPAYGGLHHFAFVSIRKTHPFQARQAASALWGSAALRFTRFLIVVDAEVNVRDAQQVLSEVGAHASVERDVFSYDGPTHASDSTGPIALGRHLGIDATTKIAGEQSGAAPQRLSAGEEIIARVTARWAEFKLDAARDFK